MLQQTWQELEGKVLDEKLLLVRYLGGCSGSAVFLADEIGGKPTAIKLIPMDSQAPEAQLARLRTAAGLSHPNLIRILEVGRYGGEDNESFYARMEYADENLGQFLPRRKLTVEEAHQLIRPLLDVLAYLHGQGLAHGRIKPSNVLAIGEEIKLSSEVYPAGELAPLRPESIYTAPEAPIDGITAAADAWSLGVILVHAISGELPVWENRNQDPEIPATLPAPFDDVARHCLRRDPRQRWTTREIDSYLRQKTRLPQRKQADAVQQPAATGIRGPRRRMILAALAALVVAAVLGFVLRGDRSGAASARAHSTSEATVDAAQPQDSQPVPAANSPADALVSAETGPAAAPPALKGAAPENGQDLILHREMPNVSQRSLNTIHGTIRVRIRLGVNAAGEVKRARFVTHGPSNYFAERAMQAAKLWKFKPQEVSGRNGESQWTLHFQYRKSGTNVIPEQAGG
jgi:TonB family protein